MNYKESGRQESWPDCGDIPTFASWVWRKLEKLSFRIAGVPAGIRTEYLPNTSLEYFR
jgi:hypothetical protein